MRSVRNIRLFHWYNFLSDVRPYFPIEALYFAGITGSYAAALSMPSIVMLSAAVFEVPTGVLSDMAGRRRTVIIGSACSVAGMFLYAAGTSWAVFAVGAVFHGLARAFWSGNNDALLHDTLADEGRTDEYAHYAGRIGSMFQAGLSVGALIAIAAAWTSLSFIVWISIIPQALCLLLSFFFVEPRKRSAGSTNVFSHLRKAVSLFRQNRRLQLLTIGASFKHGIGEAMFYAEPIFVASLWPAWGVGVQRALNHLFGWIGFWYAGKAISRYSLFPALLVSMIGGNILALIAFGFPTVISPLLIALMALLYGTLIVSGSTLLQREFSDEQRATMGSLISLSGSIVFAFAAIGFGWLTDMIGPARALLLGEMALVCLVPLYVRLHRADKQAGQRS